jgi:hypothetical protein
VLSIVAVMALAAKNMARGNAGRSWMAVRDMDVAGGGDRHPADARKAARRSP